jgi:predicted SprT family Zn-dependent metalloprotease
MDMNPTTETYNGLQVAYDFFNQRIFDAALPHCLMTLQRHRRTYAYYSPKRFVRRSGEQTDEIALNPAYFATRSIEEVLASLAHEMVHMWQEEFGKPGRGRYHNKEWAEKMESIGLMPSSTGKPGGKRVGDKVHHFIIEGGRFDLVCKRLLEQRQVVEWLDRLAEPAPYSGKAGEADPDLKELGIELTSTQKTTDKSNRQKYSHRCTTGKPINVWGKPDLSLFCGNCGEAFRPV